MTNWLSKGWLRRILHTFEFTKPYTGPLGYYKDEHKDHYTNRGSKEHMSVLHGNIDEIVAKAEETVNQNGDVRIWVRDGRYKTLIQVAKELQKKGYIVIESSWESHRNKWWVQEVYVKRKSDKDSPSFSNWDFKYVKPMKEEETKISLDNVLSGKVKLPKGLILDNINGVATVVPDERVNISRTTQLEIDDFMSKLNE